MNIPALEWRFLESTAAPDAVASYRDPNRTYHAVGVEREQLFKKWPPLSKAPPTEKRGRGKPPVVKESTKAAIRCAMAEEGFDPFDPKNKQTYMAKRFRVSRTTIRDALDEIRIEDAGV
ncbi:hypothetical protein WOB59_10850 [Methylocystis sp. IM4]|uniref:hypothetical protein n=1 Tax=Methylocystis sp. IM4 TaxID=3136560 RepID=UPI0031196DF4